ncbi:MAG: hypothetical protein H7Z16_16830 [Pyrinomonadaceae bacterium]|nr:hypothetical protein [Pyrinomonadaceae bacterium]
MRQALSLVLAILSIAAPVMAQTPAAAPAATEKVQPSQTSAEPSPLVPPETQANMIPDGTLVDIEAPYTINSMDFKAKDKISFRVVNPVKVNGVTVIEQGATATARIDKAKRGGHWGKAGLFVFTMQSVTAVDGSQIPLRAVHVRLRGDSKGAKVATAMVITGALMPLIAPVALLHGFKRGKDAFIPAGKRYSVFVDNSSAIQSLNAVK